MSIVNIVMNFSCDGFEELDEDEKLDAIEEVLESGAESTNSSIRMKSIGLLNEKQVKELELFDTIKREHSKKSKQHKKLKKSMHKRVPIESLQRRLAYENSYTINWQDYDRWGEVNDGAYARDVAKQETRISLLEDLIRECQ